ncbi:MAG: formate dehydrogenase subunit delta [Planctomycetota bacterium]|jgi:formate dehydrogenase subunit delta
MEAAKLVGMANQIASFFATEPDRPIAVAGTANHIQKFWEPRMRKTLLEVFDAGGDHGLHELVVAAITEHRAGLEPITA